MRLLFAPSWLFLIAASASALPISPLRITGIVTSSRDGAPIPRCTVRVTPFTEEADARNRGGRPARPGAQIGRPAVGMAGGRGGFPQDGLTTLTDASGHFSIAVPSAGNWTLSGVARGFPRQLYQQHEQFYTGVVVSSANPEASVDFVLAPSESIAGFARDEFGEAVQGGQVVAQRRVAPDESGAPVVWLSAGFTQTDDRGHYEFTGLPDGDYRLAISAHPWYATGGAGFSFRGGNVGVAASALPSPLDPSLDVVFPVTWFPGTSEERSADVLTLRTGEDRQADFHLQAVPALYLIVPPAPGAEPAENETRRPGRGALPSISRQTSGSLPFGGGNGQTTTVDRDGSLEIGGLTPGTYQVRMPDGDQGEGRLMEVTLGPGSSSAVSMENAVPAVKVSVELQGAEPSDLRSLTLTDLKTGIIFSDFQRGVHNGGPRPVNADAEVEIPRRTIQVPPGDYFLYADFTSGLSLTSMTATGAKSVGPVLTITDGHPSITLHVVRGSAHLSGIATEAGKPNPGAMILLVPAAYGSPAGMAEIRRDQTSTDGSFSFRNVPPGPYLLVSIAHGWDVAWREPATLAKYLAQGTPLTVPATGEITRAVQSVEP